ncbi:TauD/TfdA dioxygenase family protein [Kineosporia succinea]|uniref:Taurine dioxygenase n=1 Tax=Kineosporia succinea TaxID=84632 RepID=A0ABT9PC63_9ACTN|nr:TauD/TfdA family dioxygenase [Kineosporia succinea]MDP9830286.1 taurine dioxygenase [Kineosporia succinea]
MRTVVLNPVGAQVSDLPLSEPSSRSAPDVSRLRLLLAEHGVLVLPGQEIDDPDFLAFLRCFGRLTFTAGETPVPGFPDLNVISNVGRTTPPRSVFHVDTSYVSNPPAYTALRAVTVPEQGGQTLFTNQYRAYDTLPADLRESLHGRTVRHVVTGLSPDAAGPETEAHHPVFPAHPISGRTTVYISTPERCVSVEGLDAERSRQVVAALYEHSTSQANVFRHTWSAGDVVIWDNRVVMHRADHEAVSGDRVMHRGMVTA